MITVQLEDNGPITEMDESLLKRVDGYHEDEREATQFIEYWLDRRCVHRSVHVTLKKGLEMGLEQGSFA